MEIPQYVADCRDISHDQGLSILSEFPDRPLAPSKICKTIEFFVVVITGGKRGVFVDR